MDKAEPEVEVVVDLDLSDLLRANLWARYGKWSTLLSLAATVLLTILFALFVFSTLVSPAFLLIPLGLFILEVLILLAIIFETWRNYSAVKDFQKQITYHLNRAMDNGLTQDQAGEVVAHLAFYAGWPNAFR